MITAYLIVASVGMAGLILRHRPPVTMLCTTFLLSQFLPTLMTFAISRYRFASMSLLMISASWLILEAPQSWRSAAPIRRVTAVGAAGLLLLLAASRFNDVVVSAWS